MDSSTSFIPETSAYRTFSKDVYTFNGSLTKSQSEKSGSAPTREAES